MVDAATAAEGTGRDSSVSMMTSSLVKVGDRMRFSVELRPGETTIVSWKKFMKEASKSGGVSSSSAAGAAASATGPPVNVHPSLESRLAPGDSAAIDSKDAPAPNRFNAVIEKIERLYMGKDSSDDEDMADIPDDDQYDTEDSFIDDEELDDYFEVDKAKAKHDGYFVNRGALEKVSEPLELPIQQPKKRRRKESTKAPGDDDINHRPKKLMKEGRKFAGQFDSSIGKNILPVNQVPCVNNVEKLKNPNQPVASKTHLQKVLNDGKALSDITPLRISNGDASSSLAQGGDKQNISMLPNKNSYSKLKENIVEESVLVMQQDKNGMHEKIDLNLPDCKHTMQSAKTSLVNKKEGSNHKPKANSLEKAIKELQKMVVEFRSPASDAQDTDAAASIKRRLPREIKLKLAKIAKIANAIYGKVSKELLHRLMGIVGHWCQIRTLKRHLNVVIDTSLSPKQEKDDKAQLIKNEIMMNTRLSPKQEKDKSAQQIKNEIIMNTSLSLKHEKDDKAQQIKDFVMNTSLSPKQEKNDKFQQMKKEIMELIQACASSLISKGSEQQSGVSGDAHKAGNPYKALKEKLYMDVVLEDKLCDIYDVFVNGLDKDAAPQVRVLYAELAELWPRGFMDNRGIRRAICRAKERKGASNGTNKEKDKIKRKKVVALEVENHVHGESSSLPQLQLVEHSRVIGTDPTNVPFHSNRSIPSTSVSSAVAPTNPTTLSASLPMPISSTHLPNFERAKHEKVKASTNNTSLITDGVVVKKKIKKRAEISGESGHLHADELSSHHSNDNNRQKQHKNALTVPLQSGQQNKSSFDVFRFSPLT